MQALWLLPAAESRCNSPAVGRPFRSARPLPPNPPLRIPGYIGPSGCGKSALLRLLAGLILPTEGSVTHLSEPGDGAGGPLLVRQENSLFPWKTALENATFGLQMQGIARELREPRARALFNNRGRRVGSAGPTTATTTPPRQLQFELRRSF